MTLTFDRFFQLSNLPLLLSLYTIQPNLIKIGQELFELLQSRTNRQTKTEQSHNLSQSIFDTLERLKYVLCLTVDLLRKTQWLPIQSRMGSLGSTRAALAKEVTEACPVGFTAVHLSSTSIASLSSR